MINYLSSLFSLTLLMFLPGMVGLILGQVFAGSVAVLLALPLLAGDYALSVLTDREYFGGDLAFLRAVERLPLSGREMWRKR